MSKGTLVCGGITFHITNIELRNSNIVLTATAQGPTPAFIKEPVAIFGADGKGIGQGAVLEFLRPTRDSSKWVTLTFSLLIERITEVAL